MMKFIYIIGTCLLGVIIASCDKCDGDRPDNSFAFYLVNTSGQNLLGPAAGLTHPDSVRLFINGQEISIEVKENNIFNEGFGVIAYPSTAAFNGRSDARVLVRLGRTDTDTLDIIYRLDRTKCFDLLRFDDFYYNLQPVARNASGVPRVQK